MQKKNQQFSLLRVVQSDYAAFLSLMFPTVAWAIYIAIANFGYFPAFRGHEALGSEAAPFFLYAGLVTTVICVPLFVWRLHFFRTLYRHGVQVMGCITSVSFQRDRGRIEYSYMREGKTYSSYAAVMKTARTRGLAPESDVTLLVDQSNPQRSLIFDLYV